jgi:hypothetical protein
MKKLSVSLLLLTLIGCSFETEEQKMDKQEISHTIFLRKKVADCLKQCYPYSVFAFNTVNNSCICKYRE